MHEPLGSKAPFCAVPLSRSPRPPVAQPVPLPTKPPVALQQSIAAQPFCAQRWLWTALNVDHLCLNFARSPQLLVKQLSSSQAATRPFATLVDLPHRGCSQLPTYLANAPAPIAPPQVPTKPSSARRPRFSQRSALQPKAPGFPRLFCVDRSIAKSKRILPLHSLQDQPAVFRLPLPWIIVRVLFGSMPPLQPPNARAKRPQTRG